jgi:hypothetical protein
MIILTILTRLILAGVLLAGMSVPYAILQLLTKRKEN